MLDEITKHVDNMCDEILDDFNHIDLVVGCPPGYIAPSGAAVPIEETRGQADTIYQLCRYGRTNDDGPVLVINSDVLVSHLDMLALLSHTSLHAMVTLVHESTNPALSYINKYPQPTKYAEKQIVSKYGMTGVWAFASRGQLMRVLGEYLLSKESHGREPYLSHVLHEFYPAYAVLRDRSTFIDLGTPEAVVAAGYKIHEAEQC